MAYSGYSDVYRGLWHGRAVALKALRVNLETEVKVTKVKDASQFKVNSNPSLMNKQAFHDEVVVWRHLKHPNITPFLGVSTSFTICLVSEWMQNGNIGGYLKHHRDVNRITLVSFMKDMISHYRYFLRCRSGRSLAD